MHDMSYNLHYMRKNSQGIHIRTIYPITMQRYASIISRLKEMYKLREVLKATMKLLDYKLDLFHAA
jgi:hypothetical protein